MNESRKNIKVKSIKTQIRNLQISTILLLIITGCLCAILIYSHHMKAQKIVYMENVLDEFYEELIENRAQELMHQSGTIAALIGAQSDSDKRNLAMLLSDEDISISFFTADISDYTTEYYYELNLVPEDLFDALLKDSYYWIEGSEQDGFYIYAKTRVMATSEYIVTYAHIMTQDIVNQIRDRFDVDATVFYKNKRMATSIEIEGNNIVGTTLNDSLSDELLSNYSEYFGTNTIASTPYLSAYESFGNADEMPIGILFVGETIEEFNLSIQSMIISIIALGCFLLIISSILSTKWVQGNIVAPLESLTLWVANYSEDRETNEIKVHFKELDRFIDTIMDLLKRLGKAREEVEHIAYYDELTKLPNRYMLMKKHDLNPAEGKPFGYLLYIDADNLKTVNDILGHHTGDKLIVAIGCFLLNKIKAFEGAEVYRIGGDEFVVWLPDYTEMATVEDLLDKIRVVTTDDAALENYGLNTTLSVGVAKCNPNTKNFSELLRFAEIAMYKVKHSTKNDYAIYDSSMSEDIVARQALESDLRQAIQNNELFLVFQPKYNIKENLCDGFEALVRWAHPTKGNVSPADFIPIAEETGLIIPIGDWVLEESCKRIKAFNSESKMRYRVSVNVSTIQILQEDFVEKVIETMVRFGVEPNMLEIEITESVLIESLSTSVEKLRQLLILGVGISIDDFGKGYSSLAYLKHLPISSLKIDKMFIDDIIDNDQIMVDDIIELGHNLGLKIVAEGIETGKQMDYLKEAACDVIQGYYYAKPLSDDDLEAFVREKNGHYF